MLKLEEAAKISQCAARCAVQDAMRARQLGSPWEVTECMMKIYIFKQLFQEIQTTSTESEKLCLWDELQTSKMVIPKSSRGGGHPVDLVLTYPSGSSDRYHPYGLIEIKKNFPEHTEDAKWLDEISKAAANESNEGRKLKWVLFVVFVNGTKDNIKQKITKVISESSLEQLQQGDDTPLFADSDIPIARVGDTHYQIICFGRNIISKSKP